MDTTGREPYNHPWGALECAGYSLGVFAVLRATVVILVLGLALINPLVCIAHCYFATDTTLTGLFLCDQSHTEAQATAPILPLPVYPVTPLPLMLILSIIVCVQTSVLLPYYYLPQWIPSPATPPPRRNPS